MEILKTKFFVRHVQKAAGGLLGGAWNWEIRTRCNKNNERVMSQKWLGMRMSEKGFKRVITNGQRLWCGLAVKMQWK